MKSQQEYYELFINEVQSQDPSLTDTHEGSKLDIIGGAVSTGLEEIKADLVDEFAKTFIETANGPQITGGPDDLERLLVDHFGDRFARPEATFAKGVVTFSRANADAGDVLIEAGTVVKTAPNAAGVSQRFEVEANVTLTGTSINASVNALSAGPDGNVVIGAITQIETSLTDSSVTVTNAAAFSGGEDELDDAEYREYARNLLQTLKGATLAAIKAVALTVPGVEVATGAEFIQTVIEWDVPNGEPVGEPFKIVRVKLFIADANGSASDPLIEDVEEAVAPIRAAGVQVEIFGATALSQNWSISIVLDPSGPNYATLQNDISMIEDSMAKYIQDLEIGEDFNRAAAKQYLLDIYGPAGTEDLTSLTMLSPTGDVSVSEDEKLIPGTMSVV